jgi:hypothetical protein
VIRSVNIAPESTTIGFKSPDILIKGNEIVWVRNIIGKDGGYFHAPEYNYWGELYLQ